MLIQWRVCLYSCGRFGLIIPFCKMPTQQEGWGGGGGGVEPPSQFCLCVWFLMNTPLKKKKKKKKVLFCLQILHFPGPPPKKKVPHPPAYSAADWGVAKFSVRFKNVNPPPPLKKSCVRHCLNIPLIALRRCYRMVSNISTLWCAPFCPNACIVGIETWNANLGFTKTVSIAVDFKLW